MAAQPARRSRTSIPPLSEQAVPVVEHLPLAAPVPQPAPEPYRQPAHHLVQLTPKDIQKRIRSGARVEDIVAATGMDRAKVELFALPILAERAHIAELAQKATVRREGAGPRTLGESVFTRLDALELGVETVEWDSHQLYDGRWHVVAQFSTPVLHGVADFTFDHKGNFITLDNDQARWLALDLDVESLQAEAAARDDLFAARVRRATVVETTVVETTVEAWPEIIDMPVEAFLTEPASVEPEQSVEASSTTSLPPTAAPVESAPVESEPTVAIRPAKKKRSSVPSWDDIMFGTK